MHIDITTRTMAATTIAGMAVVATPTGFLAKRMPRPVAGSPGWLAQMRVAPDQATVAKALRTLSGAP